MLKKVKAYIYQINLQIYYNFHLKKLIMKILLININEFLQKSIDFNLINRKKNYLNYY